MVIQLVIAILVVCGICLAASLRVVKQFERGVVFRFGRLLGPLRGPGLTAIIPGVDRLQKVNLQIVTMPVPGQEGITKDNVTVRVDAVVYFNVTDPARAVINVEDYLYAMGQVAQTSLRSILGKSDLDDLLSNRERLNEGLEVMIDSPALGWGVHIDRVEIKDVSLPETMRRSIARQAEAERERRSRIISADGEYQASQKLSEAAEVMADAPAALQLRLLETVVEVAAEKNSTLVLPFPVELLRFVEKFQPGTADAKKADPEKADAEKAGPQTTDKDNEKAAEEPAGETSDLSAQQATTGAGTPGVDEPGSTTASAPQPRQSADTVRPSPNPQGIA